jgi:septum formation protein
MSKACRWILASASPRRRELLKLLIREFEAVSSDVDESVQRGESPATLVQRLAREKALAVQKSNPDATILGADTIVVCDREMLGKPTTAEEARRMLRRLSGRIHQVLTGVCLLDPKNLRVDVASTNVQVSVLSDSEIDCYVKSGEPLDKAGAYGIQGMGARFIERIDGCYFNVVGLPVSLIYRMLKEMGYEPDG